MWSVLVLDDFDVCSEGSGNMCSLSDAEVVVAVLDGGVGGTFDVGFLAYFTDGHAALNAQHLQLLADFLCSGVVYTFNM